MDTRNAELGFSFDMGGLDRQALLLEAAGQFDLRRGHLGPDSRPLETPEGELARALLLDTAEFAAFPDVYRITDEDFLERHRSVPTRFKELSEDYSFYWLNVPILLRPQRNWAFNRLEVAIEFNPGDPKPHSRPKAYQILPAKKFQTLLEVSDSLEIGLDENFEFSADTGSLKAAPGPANVAATASAGVKLSGGLGLKAGKFEYHLKRAKIDHTAVGLEKVFWRLDGAEFFQEDAPALVVIAQVPRETTEVSVAAVLQAYRYFSWLSAGVQDAVEELTRSMRNFFKAGAPLRHQASWDLTPRL